MKLIHHTISKLSIVMIIILTFWAGFFFYSILDEILDETDDTYCVWRTEFDAKKRLCFYGMDIFRLNGSLWDRSFEEHIEYAYEPDELALWLEEAGFTHIRQYGDRVLRAPKQDEQRIYFSAKKD